MNTICYRIEVKGKTVSFVVPVEGDEEKAFKIYDSLKKNLISPEENFQIEVFKIESVEKKLITENWKAWKIKLKVSSISFWTFF